MPSGLVRKSVFRIVRHDITSKIHALQRQHWFLYGVPGYNGQNQGHDECNTKERLWPNALHEEHDDLLHRECVYIQAVGIVTDAIEFLEAPNRQQCTADDEVGKE